MFSEGKQSIQGSPEDVRPVTRPYHSIGEDVFAIFTAALFVSFGVYLFKACGFLTGGTPGIALLLTYWLPFSFGQIFFVINLPFYYLAWSRLGMRFTVNTFISVTIVSIFSETLQHVLSINYLNPIFAALLGGFLIGMGILIMFRHGSSLGGLGVAAKYLQDHLDWSAGKFQMAVDVMIVSVGFFTVSLDVFGLSILGAISLNMIIAVNHKAGRYQIT